MTELVRDELLHELFETSADRWPGRTAVICGNTRLTYLELDEQANRLAHALRQRGIGREDRVAICLPRSELVYVAMLGVLKAGAAYVPLDPEIPEERARFILEDCSAKCLITRSTLMESLGEIVPLLNLDGDESRLAAQPNIRLSRVDTGTARENLCYMIYTSGTTGRPKGVQIEHRNITHLVRAESHLYGIRPEDRIFQMASVAFDASVEEIWMAFFHGATLVVGTTEIIHSGSEFAGTLASLGVTVLSCVPTFLSMLDEDIPTLRLLILGGEVCSPDLVIRWEEPDRTIFNTYGPTETTVISTAAVVTSNRPVTIGKPIANTQVFILDESGHAVPRGNPGELCIAGEGVARGYLNRSELEKEKFITTDALTGSPLRLYRSGDQARYNSEGNLEYLGRLDDQVKIRGFRIELSEIESVLTQCPGVLAAAATVHQPTQRIAAYIIPRSHEKADRTLIRRTLVDRLPAYMVPAFLDEVSALPMTTSGKIDRKQLPDPLVPLIDKTRERIGPRTDAERAVLEVWQAVLRRNDLSVQDDFFRDLDGHSLLAAIVVSKLRKKSGFENLSVGDLYAHPSVEAFAGLAAKTSDVPPSNPKVRYHAVSNGVYRACAAGQAVGLIAICGLYAWQWLGAYLAYGYLAVADWPIHQALGIAFLVLCGITPVTLLLSIAVKWLLLGRIRAGRYPLWGWFYWRFWFVRSVVRAAPVQYLDGTPLLNLYYRLMGARIERDVFLGSHGLATFDLVSVGEGTSIGINTSIDGFSVEGGYVTLAPVTIGRRCWVGNRCTLGADSVLEDDAGLDDLSMLPDGTHVPSGQLWRGSPAAPAGRLESEPARSPWSVASWIYHIAGIILFPIIIVLAVLPGLMAITHLGHLSEGYAFLLAAPLVAFSFIVFLSAELWMFKWLVIGRLRPGCYPVGGFFYARKWFIDQLMTMSADVTESLYETLYAAPWLRALGARIGSRCEIAAIELVHPDLLEMDKESMIADLALIGAPHVRSGLLLIGLTQIGRRVFIGNSAVVPAGSNLGDQVLIGLMSLPPTSDGRQIAKGSSWFGSPPIELPMRYHSGRFSESQTFVPPKRLVALRLFIELFRIFLPATIFVMLASLIVDTTDVLQDHIGFRSWLLVLPLLYAVAGILGVLITALIKWIAVGRYRSGEKPLWSGFVWRNDLVNGVYSNFCEHFFLGMLRGTPFIAWALRIFGMRIGRRCYVDTTWFTEFDLISIGNDVTLNESANLQTHLFEDRVIKMGRLRLDDRCTVGATTTVLYNTHMEEDSALEDLSLLMKGEALPAGTRWHGIPARRVALNNP